MNQRGANEQLRQNEHEEADGQRAPELDDAFSPQGRLLAASSHLAAEPAAKQSKHAKQRKEYHHATR